MESSTCLLNTDLNPYLNGGATLFAHKLVNVNVKRMKDNSNPIKLSSSHNVSLDLHS